MEQNQNEIDLIELYRKILVFISEKKYTFLLFIVLGFAGGFAYHQYKKAEVKTNFLAESKTVSKEFVMSLTDRIAFLVETGDYQGMQKELNVGQDTLKFIKEIKTDTTENAIAIKVISRSDIALSPFIAGLVRFINKQPYIVSQQAQKKKSLEAQIALIDNEINNIGVFQNQILKRLTDGEISINSISGIHKDKVEMIQLRQELAAELELDLAVTVVNQDANSLRKANSLVETMTVALILSIFAALLYFFVRYSIQLKQKS